MTGALSKYSHQETATRIYPKLSDAKRAHRCTLQHAIIIYRPMGLIRSANYIGIKLHGRLITERTSREPRNRKVSDFNGRRVTFTNANPL